MINKKSVMSFSGLMILIYHLWIIIMKQNEIENFIKQILYIGVDIFFLVSGYSLAKRKVESYGQFLFARFKSVYLKFIVFAIIAALVLNWKWSAWLRVIVGIDLMSRGGGAFLWFLPAIMLYYILFPFFQKSDISNRLVTAFVSILIWCGVAYYLTYYTNIKQVFIFWNRIPVFLIGYYLSEVEVFNRYLNNKKIKFILGLLLSIIGVFLAYKYAYRSKLQQPFVDMYYITVIPVSIGIAMLLTFIPEIKIIKYLGSSTLELYAIQMIFGYRLVNKIYLKTENAILTNILMILLMTILAIVVHYAYEYILQLTKKFIPKK